MDFGISYYQLLCKKVIPKHHMLNSKHYLMVPVGQESRHSLTGCLWLKISHEAAVKLLAEAVISSDGLSGWMLLILLVWFLVDFRSLLCRLLHRAAP